MMNVRGGLLALVVLAIATLLMVFFVLPRITDVDKPAETTVTKAADPAKEAADQAAAAAKAVTEEASGKMGRLGQAADTAVKSLQALFAEGKVPALEAYAGARGVAETAITALSNLDIPAGIEAAVSDALTQARDHGKAALALLKDLPADPKDAAGAIDNIGRALTGQPLVAASPPAAPVPSEQSAAPAAPADPATPRFDILRVEPDGSTVIAGNAAPGSKIEILDGGDVISSLDVGPAGDFAAVLDTPLTPGDHSIELRSTDKDGKATKSEEVATVSVPATASGKLLAMISKPGEASRLITLPETVNAGDKQARVTTEAAPASATVPALPAASAELSTTAPAIAAAPAAAQPASVPAVGSEVQVTAVEIEGDRIFVAGTAAAGSRIRALADDKAIGEISADASGHFVVEGKMALSVGPHTIIAELLDTAGKVALRVAVPFDRPAGEQVAVVAPGTNAAGSAPAGALVPLDQSAFDTLRDGVGRAFAILQGLYADGRTPTQENLAAARSATEIALKSLVEFRPDSETDAAAGALLAKTLSNAKAALSALQGLPKDIAAVGAALPRIAALIDAVVRPLPGEAPAAAATLGQPTTTMPQAAPAPTSAPVATTEAQPPKTIAQAPLTPSNNSVIIRRGDTLWQISRRVYGQGVRYTTIYLANEASIRNPDLIAPGQIFSVPAQALPNAEQLHRERMKHPAGG